MAAEAVHGVMEELERRAICAEAVTPVGLKELLQEIVASKLALLRLQILTPTPIPQPSALYVS